MTWNQIRSAGVTALASLLLLGAASSLQAQSPTPEGTVITNVATVTFTDANNNTYSSVQASVSVTVGFVAGIDVAGAAAATPASPSAANTLTFTIQNIGNGTDHVQVAENISVGGVITVQHYTYNATNYASIAALNTALAGGAGLAQNATITVQVVYDVSANKGGVLKNYTLTGTSVRTNTVSDFQLTAITTAQTFAVSVTPDGGQNLQQLPSNGTNYTFAFTVQNGGNGSDVFVLTASNTGSAITVVSVNGVAGSGPTNVTIPANSSVVVNVVYSIGNVAAGTTDNLKLHAVSQGDNTKNDDGTADLTVIRPAIAVAKAAYRNDQVTLLGPTDLVLPNEKIQFKVAVTNSGTTAASSVAIDDPVPAQMTFLASTPDAAGWTISNVGNHVTATLTGTLAVGATRYIWIQAQVK